jgi:outer membrane protein
MTAVMTALMTFGTLGGAFAAGLGTVDMSALLQQHPKFAQTMSTWQSDVKKAQTSFQAEAKKTTDKTAQQSLVQKYNTQLNKQRIELFSPLEKDVLEKTNQVKAEKGLDYVVLKGAVVSGQSTDITGDVAKKLK